MATAALVTGPVTVLNTPFLIKKITLTGGATPSTAITHGQSVAPDLYWGAATDDASYCGAVTFDDVGATTLLVRTTTDAAGTATAWLVWFPQASGGLNP